MDNRWLKHGKQKNIAEQSANGKHTVRRLALPVTKELETVLEKFRQMYPTHEFSDVSILKTFIETGIRQWAMETMKAQQNETAE